MFAYTWAALKFRLAIGLLAIGGVLLYFGYQEWKLASSASATPQDLTVEELLARGPEGNPYVRLKNYKLGEDWWYLQDEDASDWSTVYVPALPKGSGAAAGRAKVIVITNNARNEQEFAAFRARATVFGTVLSAKDLSADVKQGLATEYPGTDFDKSLLLQEGRQPSSANTLALMLGGGVGLLVVGGGLMAFSFTGNSNTTGDAPAARGPTAADGRRGERLPTDPYGCPDRTGP